MRLVAKVVGESVVGGGGSTVPLSVHYDRVVYLPSNTDDYTGTFVTIPAHCSPWSSYDEKKFVTSLLDGLNKNKLAGRDREPNLSRSGIRPAMYSALRTGSVKAAVIIGGSHAANLANAASALGLDVYNTHKGRMEADERKCRQSSSGSQGHPRECTSVYASCAVLSGQFVLYGIKRRRQYESDIQVCGRR